MTRVGAVVNSVLIFSGKLTIAIDPLGVVIIGMEVPSSTPSNDIVSSGSYPIPGFDTNTSVISPIILVEIPKVVYPEIRETLCYLFEKSGFKNVNLQKEVDFKKLYENKKN